MCHLAAIRACHAMALVFGDVRFDMRQLRYLMPPRLTCCSSPFQIPPTMTALRRTAPDHFIDSCCRCQSTPVSRMTGLAARTAGTLPVASALAWRSRQSVRRRRFGRGRRVLPAQTQLTFQIRHLLFRYRQLFLALRQLLPQTLVIPPQRIQLTVRIMPVLILRPRRTMIAPRIPQISILPGFELEGQAQSEDS